MPNRNYQRGYKVENKLVNLLKDTGCDIAVRTAGSHSPIDVIGFNTEQRVIIVAQCKTNKKIIEKENTDILRSLKGKDWVIIAHNVYSDRGLNIDQI